MRRVFILVSAVIFLVGGMTACQTVPLDSEAEEREWEALTPDQQRMMERDYDVRRQEEVMSGALDQAERSARSAVRY